MALTADVALLTRRPGGCSRAQCYCQKRLATLSPISPVTIEGKGVRQEGGASSSFRASATSLGPRRSGQASLLAAQAVAAGINGAGGRWLEMVFAGLVAMLGALQGSVSVDDKHMVGHFVRRYDCLRSESPRQIEPPRPSKRVDRQRQPGGHCRHLTRGRGSTWAKYRAGRPSATYRRVSSQPRLGEKPRLLQRELLLGEHARVTELSQLGEFVSDG